MGKNKVLIAGKDGRITADLKQSLERLGYAVPAPLSDTGGIHSSLARHKPAVLLMDVNLLGKMDRIKTPGDFERSVETPVVFFTVNARDPRLRMDRKPLRNGFLAVPAGDADLAVAVALAVQKKAFDVMLLERDDRYRVMFEISLDPIVMFDLSGAFLLVNQQAALVFGLDTPEEFLAEYPNIMDALDDEGRARAASGMVEVLNGSRIIRNEYTFFTRDGRTLYGEVSSSIVCDAAGNPTAIVSIVHNVTERKKMAEALASSEERFRLLFENSPIGLLRFDRKGVITECNDVFVSIIGSSRDSLIGLDMLGLRDEGVVGAVRNALQGSTGFHEGEYRSVTTPKVTDVRTIFAPLRSAGGSIIGGVGIVEDMTERNKAEKSLRESEEKYRLLVDNANEAIFVAQDGKMAFINPKVEEVSGYSREELMMQPFTFLIHPEDRDMVMDRHKRRTNGEDIPATYSFRMVRKDGEVRRAYINVVRLAWGGRPAFMSFLLDITESARAQEELRKSEEMFRTLTEKMKDIVWVAGLDLKITYISPSVEAAIGFTPEERMAQEVQETLTPESYARAVEVFSAEMLRDGEPGVDPDRALIIELEYCHKDGSTVWIENNITSIRDELGAIIGFHGVSRDVTERRRAQDLLRFSEQKFESAFNSSPDPMAITSLETGLLVDVNQAFLSWSGYSQDEVIGRSGVALGLWVDPDERDRVIRDMQKGTSHQRYVIRMRRKNGEIRDMYFWIRVLEVSGGRFTFTLAHDATDEKVAAQRMMDKDLFLREAQRIARLGGWKANPRTDYLEWTEGVYDIIGVPHDYKPGLKEAMKYYHPDSIPVLVESMEACLATGLPFTVECQVLNESGKILWTEVRGYAAVSEEGHSYVMGTFQDITARKEDEEELRKLASAIEQAAECIVITDRLGTIQYVNPVFEKVTGYGREEVVGNNPRILKSGEHDQPFYEDLWGTISNGGTWSGRLVNKRKDGTLYHEDATISPIKDEKGMIVNFVGVKRDVTREVSLEDQLARSQKLQAIGTLAGGIAHDFNNILSIIMGFSELSLEVLPEDNPAREMVGEVLKAGERARDLVRQILTFSRKMESSKEPVKVHLIAKETVKLLRSTIPRNIEIRDSIDPGAGPVDADPTKIHQIIMNLCTNAYHAMMPSGGTMTVSLKHVAVDRKLLGQIPSLKAGPHLRLTVKDTGCGMVEDTLKRIFDPFFTTKEKGRGTGLGLAMVYGIVTDLGGAITVDSAPGKGSVFTVYLPVSERAQEKDVIDLKEDTFVPKRGHILLVDDEESVINFSRLILEGLGYSVTSASRSIEALTLFKSTPHAFDLVLSDCTMPGLDGEHLARSIFSIRPDIPVVLMTGFSETISEEKARELGIASYIEKPFSRKSLSAALSSCFEDKGR